MLPSKYYIYKLQRADARRAWAKNVGAVRGHHGQAMTKPLQSSITTQSFNNYPEMG
jgi:hypothetical protein